jgi:hypothetical protein
MATMDTTIIIRTIWLSATRKLSTVSFPSTAGASEYRVS